MFLQDKETGNLVKIMDVSALLDPNETEIVVRSQSGEEEQDPEAVAKLSLIFPSGESIPRCWIDSNYRNT